MTVIHQLVVSHEGVENLIRILNEDFFVDLKMIEFNCIFKEKIYNWIDPVQEEDFSELMAAIKNHPFTNLE